MRFVKINIFNLFTTVVSFKDQIYWLNKQKRFFAIIDSLHFLKDRICVKQTSLVTQSGLLVNDLIGLAHVLFIYVHVKVLKFYIRKFGLMLIWDSLNFNNLLFQFQRYSEMQWFVSVRVEFQF